MKGIHQNYSFLSDFSTEFQDYVPYSHGYWHQFSAIEPCTHLTEPERVSEQQSFRPESSSDSIISRIGSQASAFYATERHMGLPQFNFQENNSTPCSQQFKNLYKRTPNSQYDNGLLSATKTQTSNGVYNRAEGSFENRFSNLSEKEQILYLKNKLLGDLDDSYRGSPSAPFDANQDLVSQNLFATHAPVNQFGSSISSASSGSVSSSKTRIRWSSDLHDQFVECVNRLGGPEKATPKAILNLMDTEGLTIFHVKSHLQKYRNAKYIQEAVEEKSECRTGTSKESPIIDIKTGMQLKEALQMQLDVQKHLYDQLETQRNLQMRIEEQTKQLKNLIDQQNKTAKTFMVSSDLDSKCPTNRSTTLEDEGDVSFQFDCQ